MNGVPFLPMYGALKASLVEAVSMRNSIIFVIVNAKE